MLHLLMVAFIVLSETNDYTHLGNRYPNYKGTGVSAQGTLMC